MKIRPVFFVLSITLLCQISLAQELLTRNICGISDKFLCQAVANGLKTASQQKNATAIQTFRQLKNSIPTGKDVTYLLSIKNNKELYQLIKDDGSLGGSQRDFPHWPKVKIQTTTSWFTDLDNIFRFGEFYPDFSESETSRTYRFFVSRKFSLFHEDVFVTKIYTEVEGWAEFDKKSRLLTKLYFRHLIPKNESEQHKFVYVDRYTEYEIASVDEERYPVPVKFVSNMATKNDSVAIHVFYRDYKITDGLKNIEYVPVRYKLDTVASFLELDFTIIIPKMKENVLSRKLNYAAFDRDKVYKMDIDYLSGKSTRRRSCTAVAYKHSNDTTFLLTNTHCLEFATGGVLFNKTKRLFFVRGGIRNLEDDISVVEVVDTTSEDFILDIGGKVHKNDTVQFYGYPSGYYKELQGSVVANHSNLITDTFQYIREAVSVDMKTGKGASGSAIVKDNKIAGIMSSIGYLDGYTIKTGSCNGCRAVSFFIDGNKIYKKLAEAGLL